MSQIASQYSVHPTQIGQWKKQAIEILKVGFTDKRKRGNDEQEQKMRELYQTIGRRLVQTCLIRSLLTPSFSARRELAKKPPSFTTPINTAFLKRGFFFLSPHQS